MLCSSLVAFTRRILKSFLFLFFIIIIVVVIIIIIIVTHQRFS